MKVIQPKYISATLIIFIALMLLVKSNLILIIDEPIYGFVRLLHNIPFMDTFLYAYSNIFAPWHMVGFMAVILILLFFKSKRLMLTTTIWAVSTLLLGIGLKYFIHRPRPINEISGYSFPSLHTLTFAVAMVVFLTLFRKMRWHVIAYIMILVMMISRIYVHAHFFSDTVGSLIFMFLTLQIALHNINKYELNVPFISRLITPWHRDT